MPSPEAAPTVPSWFTPGDPWLSTKMRHVAEIADAERRVGQAVEQALAAYLAMARERMSGLQAAAVPDLSAWPERERNWLAVLVNFLWELLKALFTGRFRRDTAAVDRRIDTSAYIQEYLDGVWQRLKVVPEIVFEEVQLTIRQAADRGESPQRIRERVMDLLRIDAPSRALRALIDRLERTIADPDTPENVRREARARLAAARRRTGRGDVLWWPLVAKASRTESAAVLNAATEHAGNVLTQVTGQRQYKQWLSLMDAKVRAAHRRAHGQTQPVGRVFRVGGFPMRFPGDPTAPVDLTANCRCSLLLLGPEEGPRRQRDYLDRSRLTASGPSTSDSPEVGRDPGGGAMTTAHVHDAELDYDEDDTEGPSTLAAGAVLPQSATTVAWSGLLAPFGTPSGDGRVIQGPTGAPNTRDLPLPLLWQKVTADGHDGSVVVGNITRVWTENGNLMGRGRFDLGSADGREIVRQISEGFARWVSVGLDNGESEAGFFLDGRRLSMEEYLSLDEYTSANVKRVTVVTDWRLVSLTLVAEPAFHTASISLIEDEDDDEVDQDDEPEALVAAPTAEKRHRAEDSGAAMPGGRYPIENRDDLLKAIKAVGRAGGKDGTDSDRAEVRRHVIKRAKALGLSMLIPDSWNSDGTLKPTKASLAADASKISWYEQVAAAIPLEPPAEWFRDPQLTGPTKMRVTAEGRVYGHIADWKQCHASIPGQPAPRAVDRAYSKFHRHPVRCANGSRIKTGPLAAGGHASAHERELWAVQQHYDDPRYVLADVVVGEDEHGLWCSGSLRYGISAYQVMFADRYSFSGDWRNGELLAACAVSVPGFHLDDDDEVVALAASAQSPQALVAESLTPRMSMDGDEVVALLAAGVVLPEPEAAASLSVATITVDPNAEQWRDAGRQFALGQHEAELEIAAEKARVKEARANAAIVAEVAGRVYGPRFATLRIPASPGGE